MHPPLVGGATEPDTHPKAVLLGARYRVERELGTGGMATVFLATDTKHGRRVAVKILLPELAASLAAGRFLREIDIAAQLLHPHILGLIDSGEIDGAPFYVMPYVEGESLRDWIGREGRLPAAEVTRLLGQVLSALSYAHQRGIVHRDIKPGNVLVSSASSETRLSHALVSDFGVAKALAQARAPGTAGAPGDGSERASRLATATAMGTVIGTPAYMAPEQAAGDPNVDHRADLYATGALAYELLTGAPPFAGETPAQLLAAHLTRAPEPLARRGVVVAASLERLVMRCLEKQPAQRFQTAAEAMRALEDTTATTTLTVGPPPTLAERKFVLTEEECRKLDRATLDPRIIGDTVSYLDNQRESQVMVAFVHGTGLDQHQSEGYLRELPYRAIAPTLYGFERQRHRRIPLRLDDQITIQRALIGQVARDSRAQRVAIVGLSSGGDLVLRMVAEPEHATLPTHGVLALGANLSLATCFATSLFAGLGGESIERLLDGLRSIESGITSLDAWLNVHGYLVEAIRKFRGNVAVVRQFARDIVAPFAAGSGLPAERSPFVSWYRAATERVARVRCVFEDDDIGGPLLAEIRLAHLDRQVLGPRHRSEDIVVEPGATHFDLFAPATLYRHLESVLAD